MPTAPIVLTEEETTALRLIAQQTGKTEDELIREAVGRFLDESRQPHRRGTPLASPRRTLPQLRNSGRLHSMLDQVGQPPPEALGAGDMARDVSD